MCKIVHCRDEDLEEVVGRGMHLEGAKQPKTKKKKWGDRPNPFDMDLDEYVEDHDLADMAQVEFD